MLNRKQVIKLTEMVRNYEIGLLRTSKADAALIRTWAIRYEQSMAAVLQKQGKH